MVNHLFTFDNLLQQIPGLVWIKDLNLQYIGMNQNLANFMGVDRKDIFIGHDDYHLPWGKYANIYRNADHFLLDKKKPVRFIEPMAMNEKREFFTITHKSLYYDETGIAIGIIGSIVNVKSPAAIQLISEYSQIDEISGINKNGYMLCDDYDNVGLSKREGQCLFYFIRGKTVPEIANLLFISKRTAEHHITNIKQKLNCHGKSEIIEKAIDLGLVSFIPSEFLNNKVDLI